MSNRIGRNCLEISRRRALQTSAAAAGALALGRGMFALGENTTAPANHLSFNVCLSPEGMDADPDLLAHVKGAGATDVWVCGFFYGFWPYPIEKIQSWRQRIEALGMGAHICNISLGHPGDALGSATNGFPIAPPKHWKPGIGIDGQAHAGTSLHAPAAEENARALSALDKLGVRHVFLDDDFRLARMPGDIGGCFCDEHRKAFLQRTGFADGRWNDLLGAVRERRITAELRAWIDFICDELTGAFHTIQAGAPAIQLGIMVGSMCDEKTGIRLTDYKGVPMRVGEGCFDDGSFGAVASKTSELFSALLHRRFVAPELAYSETTAYPADRLSARNMAAKLCVPVLADVRNTMLMSGLRPVPREDWDVLGPARKTQIAIQGRLAGHIPRGPFKHYYGQAARLIGGPGWTELTNSLFLASGVPFEVCDEPADDGYTFLADADAHAAATGQLKSPGTTFITRRSEPSVSNAVRSVPGSLAAVFDFKRQILPSLQKYPLVEQDKPVVCAWYPTARAVLLWNLSEQRETLTLRLAEKGREIALDALGMSIIEDFG